LVAARVLLELDDVHVGSEPTQQKRQSTEEVFIAQADKSDIYIRTLGEAFRLRDGAEEIGFFKWDLLRELCKGGESSVKQGAALVLAALPLLSQGSV
jgi:hypothetical protein